jgi:GAF domain-containing protein
MERRGTMYDPLIVDTFLRVHAATPTVPREAPPTEVLNAIAHTRRAPPENVSSGNLSKVTADADQRLAVYELAKALSGHVSLSDVGDAIATHVRRLIPSSLCVFYLYDRTSDELEARHAVGEGASLVRGMRIVLGQRLSGWVAANRQTIFNSDANLDFGGTAKSLTSRLRSCISTSLVFDDELVGVLSLYSAEVDGFVDDHRRVIEAVARQIAPALKSAAASEAESQRNPLTSLRS